MSESFAEKECPECEGSGKIRTRTKSGHGRRARHKGNRGELKIAKRIGALLGVEYKDLCRTPNSGALIERSDLRMSDAVVSRFPVYIEVKNREVWTLDSLLEVCEKWVGFVWLAEAKEKMVGEQKRGNLTKNLLPVVVLMKNFRDPLVLWNINDAFGGKILCLCLRVGPYRIAPLDEFVKSVPPIFSRNVRITFAEPEPEPAAASSGSS